MGKELELIAADYANAEDARTILDTLQQMHRASNITLADAAILTKEEDGKLRIHESREVTTGKGAMRGAIVTGIFGLIYPPSLIVSALAGGALGGAWGKLRDTGIKTDDLKAIGDGLLAGHATVVALAEREWEPAIERAMEAGDGHLVRHVFSEEETEQIESAASIED